MLEYKYFVFLLHDVTALWELQDPGVHCVTQTDVCCLAPVA